jgi:DNA-binding CsgD family transcriptional regulator
VEWTFTLYRATDRAGYVLSAQRQEPLAALQALSPRESEVMQWVVQGKTNEEIGLIMGLSLNTVKTHMRRSFVKLGVENRTAAARAFMGQR